MGGIRKAEKLFTTFHQFEPRRIGEFSDSFYIPDEAYLVGDAKVMYYCSDKLNPETGEDEGWIHYFHEHHKGVRVYLCEDVVEDAPLRKIPKWIWGVQALSLIGKCEGFEFDMNGELVKATLSGRNPEWYAIPSGKALLAIEGKRHVRAIVYGGDLNVEDRGVVY